MVSFSFIPGAVNYKINNDYEERNALRNQRNTELQQQAAEDQEEKRHSSFKNLVSSFAASTTAHGLGNIAAASSFRRRMVWFVVTVGLYIVLFWMCAELVMRYMDKPVVSRMEMSFEEVKIINIQLI